MAANLQASHYTPTREETDGGVATGISDGVTAEWRAAWMFRRAEGDKVRKRQLETSLAGSGSASKKDARLPTMV